MSGTATQYLREPQARAETPGIRADANPLKMLKSLSRKITFKQVRMLRPTGSRKPPSFLKDSNCLQQ